MTPPGATAHGGPIRKVLAVWNDARDTPVLETAAGLADRHGATLTVLSCIEPPDDLAILARVTRMAPDAMLSRLEAARQNELEWAVASALAGRDARLALCRGKPFIEIIHHVMREGIDLVVKSAEPLAGVQGFLLASTDQHLVRKCPCPVWLHMRDADVTPRAVIAAVDIDDWDAAEPATLANLNGRVIETALRLAAGPEATVHVLHAWEAIAEGLVWAFSSGTNARADAESYVNEVEATRRLALDRLIARVRDTAPPGAGARIEPGLIRGPARVAIAERARDLGADAIVMGTVARTGLAGVIIGNTAEDILNHVACSVVAVKPDGFVSPIALPAAAAPGPAASVR